MKSVGHSSSPIFGSCDHGERGQERKFWEWDQKEIEWEVDRHYGGLESQEPCSWWDNLGRGVTLPLLGFLI